ncbi:MAG: hypothetical protein UX10_C0011G0009 [Candidatus Magasanikbacteria bacterium GW2011_GWA2_45_39]|uniref:PI3K/PI4K catalytic domain-containing protein n=1 Tax=Candidatus Magasanikbacteria bacterium GW2011_GWA2_45_39 TaxID=1619041 RepID=A0A0G1MGH5_9BACT|nr:MAG: hypothetical protein UX10_C0011G0009 [Candidatus Magasanikbacteria bacterium GW2011_GWA2_45_39]HBW73824.1 hypothetical protein [Candidatus Magasanikbacteria bacterium]
MNESGKPSVPIETAIASTRAESPRVVDVVAEQPARVEDHGYVREQLFRARALEDTLTQILVSEYVKGGDTASSNELIQRIKIEHALREGATREIFRIRDRKDANVMRPPEMDIELAGIQDDGSEESARARKDLEALALEAKTLRSEVQKIEISATETGEKTEAVFKPQDGEPHVMAGAHDLGTLTNHVPRGHLREWLAGFVAKSCGVERVVPPTVIREVDGRVGSVQAWAKGELAVSVFDWEHKAQSRDMETIAFLDYILDNADRHTSNFLIDNDGRLSAIDHGAILSLKQENGALRSFPLRVVSGKPISQEMVTQIQTLVDSEARMEAVESAFTFVLGEDAGPKFAQFKERVEELAGNGKFPEYTLNFQEDEAHFTPEEDDAGGDSLVRTPQTEIRTPQTEIKPQPEVPATVVRKKQKAA